jgi:hypothetical protein
MSTPVATSPAMPALPVTDYAAYRELALGVIGAAAQPTGLPEFFAPKPMSGSVTFAA